MPQGLPLSDYRAAFFDVDGTLVDSLQVYVQGIGDTYEHFLGKRPAKSVLLSLCGIPLHKQLEMFQETPPSSEKVAEMVDYAISRYKIHQSMEFYFDDAVKALQLCHRAGLQTALVTSKNAVELEHFLNRFDAIDAIDTAVCASDVINPKPAPEAAILACERLGIRPNEAVMIGDSVFDLRCARDAGVTPIAVGYGASDRETLLAESPAAFFETPAELLSWVQQSLLETSCQERKLKI